MQLNDCYKEYCTKIKDVPKRDISNINKRTGEKKENKRKQLEKIEKIESTEKGVHIRESF